MFVALSLQRQGFPVLKVELSYWPKGKHENDCFVLPAISENDVDVVYFMIVLFIHLKVLL